MVRVSLGDSKSVAVDFKTINVIDIVKQTPRYSVLYYSNDDFDVYAIWIDHQTLKVKDVLWLAFLSGNNEWQTEREVIEKMIPSALFLIKEEWRDTEWIIPQVKGDMVINDQIYYEVSANEKGFGIKNFSIRELYQREDKKLNALYRKIIKKLHKEERLSFKKVQKAWVAYKERKCALFLMNETDQDPNGVYGKLFKYNCLYQETHHRNGDLERLYEYFDFYR